MLTHFKAPKIRFVLLMTMLSSLMLLAAACLPIPTFEKESPYIDGTLTRRGAPATDTQVLLAVNKEIPAGCSKGRRETRTDQNGQFHLDRTGYLSPVFVWYDVPRRDGWALCFRFSDGLQATWSYSGTFGGPPIQRIECQVGDEAKPSSKPLQLVTAKSDQNISDACRVENVRATPTPKSR
jgi:hypothetical protein